MDDLVRNKYLSMARQRRILERKIVDSDFTTRCTKCLSNEGITYFGDLVQMTESEILCIPNCGRVTLREIKHRLSELGLTLNMNIQEWWPKKITKHCSWMDKHLMIVRGNYLCSEI